MCSEEKCRLKNVKVLKCLFQYTLQVPTLIELNKTENWNSAKRGSTNRDFFYLYKTNLFVREPGIHVKYIRSYSLYYFCFIFNQVHAVQCTALDKMVTQRSMITRRPLQILSKTAKNSHHYSVNNINKSIIKSYSQFTMFLCKGNE